MFVDHFRSQLLSEIDIPPTENNLLKKSKNVLKVHSSFDRVVFIVHGSAGIVFARIDPIQSSSRAHDEH